MYKTYVELRDERNLTDYSVAVGAGIKQSTFYDWIQRVKAGKTDAALSFENITKLAKFFNVSLDYFAE